MKRALAIILTLNMYCIFMDAQQTITLSQLNGTTWSQISPDNKATPTTVVFSCKTITRTTSYPTLNESITRTFPYYLDTKEPTSFISENVGKVVKGGYIVKSLTKSKSFQSFKVISLKNDTLTLYYEPDENAIGGNSKRGFNIVYKRVK